eukprot:PhM_4_TR17764/c0_g1_i2/m.820/K17609/NXN; nucleoredoxin
MSGFSFGPFLQANYLISKPLDAVDVSSAIDGKTVMLYFSASWCPPCRAFTPKLKTYYEALKSKHSDSVDIVFVSLDNDEQQFAEYYAKMPWLAFPYRQKSSHLMDRYNVRTIPSLVILNPDGTTLTKQGKAVVEADPHGAQYPYTAESVGRLTGSSCTIM